VVKPKEVRTEKNQISLLMILFLEESKESEGLSRTLPTAPALLSSHFCEVLQALLNPNPTAE